MYCCAVRAYLVEEFKPLAPRVPYDAPNWVRLDRPVRFAELLDYLGQLQASGRAIWPLDLTVKLPPRSLSAGCERDQVAAGLSLHIAGFA